MSTPQQARMGEPDALPVEPGPPVAANADRPLTWIEPSGFNRISRSDLAALDPLTLVQLAADVLLRTSLSFKAQPGCQAVAYNWYARAESRTTDEPARREGHGDVQTD